MKFQILIPITEGIEETLILLSTQEEIIIIISENISAFCKLEMIM